QVAGLQAEEVESPLSRVGSATFVQTVLRQERSNQVRIKPAAITVSASDKGTASSQRASKILLSGSWCIVTSRNRNASGPKPFL
ncbi:hypothetical protein, partial [Mesorhizobium sp. A623]